MPKLIEQFTKGDGVEKWVIAVKAAGPLVARQKARIYARRQDAAIKNIIEPEIEGIEGGGQTTFEMVIPETFQREVYRVSMVVFR